MNMHNLMNRENKYQSHNFPTNFFKFHWVHEITETSDNNIMQVSQ